MECRYPKRRDIPRQFESCLDLHSSNIAFTVSLGVADSGFPSEEFLSCLWLIMLSPFRWSCQKDSQVNVLNSNNQKVAKVSVTPFKDVKLRSSKSHLAGHEWQPHCHSFFLEKQSLWILLYVDVAFSTHLSPHTSSPTNTFWIKWLEAQWSQNIIRYVMKTNSASSLTYTQAVQHFSHTEEFL